MTDEHIVTVGDTAERALEQDGWKKRFNEAAAYRALDRWMAYETRNADRLRQIAIFKPLPEGHKRSAITVLPGDPLEFQVLFELKKLYNDADAIEDLEGRIKARTAILKDATGLICRLSERYAQIIDLIKDLMAREDKKSNGMDPDEIRRLAAEPE